MALQLFCFFVACGAFGGRRLKNNRIFRGVERLSENVPELARFNASL